MASNTKMNLWRLIGSLWTAWWLFIGIWITIYDYPKDVDIYAGWIHDASWYWHEIGLVFGIWLLGIVVIWLQNLLDWVKGLRGFGVLPDGRIYFVRQKRLKPPDEIRH